MRINWRGHRQNNQSAYHTYKPKSIHALDPSSVKPLNTQNTKYRSNSSYKYNQTQSTHSGLAQPYSNFSASVIHRQNNRLIQNLFSDQNTVLRNLEKEAKELQDEKQKIITKNQQQYQIMVEKLMNMRKMCNQRRQQIASLKIALQNVQQENRNKISISNAQRRYSKQKKRTRMSLDYQQ